MTMLKKMFLKKTRKYKILCQSLMENQTLINQIHLKSLMETQHLAKPQIQTLILMPLLKEGKEIYVI